MLVIYNINSTQEDVWSQCIGQGENEFFYFILFNNPPEML